MLTSVKRRVKFGLINAGVRPFGFLEAFSQLLKFASWAREARLPESRFFSDRFHLYEFVHQEIVRGDAIDYLEFGVFKGASIRRWAEMNRAPGSRFHGLDTFQGLPEEWKMSAGTLKKGHFSTGGALPEIDDERVAFVRGMFQDTLAPFLAGFQRRNRLVVHLDADLYSSTLYTLSMLNMLLEPGSIVIFDEFAFVTHEFRAFQDFAASFGKRFQVLGHSGDFFQQVAFLVV